MPHLVTAAVLWGSIKPCVSLGYPKTVAKSANCSTILHKPLGLAIAELLVSELIRLVF